MISAGPETLVILAMLSELKDRMGPQTDEVLVSVGERIGQASHFDLDGALDQFLETMNEVWGELGLGHAELSLSEQGLDIRHFLPVYDNTEGLWREALPKIIEGIYKGWFNHLDPHGHLTRKPGSGRELEFFFSE